MCGERLEADGQSGFTALFVFQSCNKQALCTAVGDSSCPGAPTSTNIHYAFLFFRVPGLDSTKPAFAALLKKESELPPLPTPTPTPTPTPDVSECETNCTLKKAVTIIPLHREKLAPSCTGCYMVQRDRCTRSDTGETTEVFTSVGALRVRPPPPALRITEAQLLSWHSNQTQRKSCISHIAVMQQ